jgi:hypothetical protein
LATDSQSILARWGNHFSQLLNTDRIDNVRQTEINTVEPLVAESSAFKFELVIEKLKSHKSAGIDQMPAEMIMAGGRIFAMRSINLLHRSTNFRWLNVMVK